VEPKRNARGRKHVNQYVEHRKRNREVIRKFQDQNHGREHPVLRSTRGAPSTRPRRKRRKSGAEIKRRVGSKSQQTKKKAEREQHGKKVGKCSEGGAPSGGG